MAVLGCAPTPSPPLTTERSCSKPGGPAALRPPAHESGSPGYGHGNDAFARTSHIQQGVDMTKSDTISKIRTRTHHIADWDAKDAPAGQAGGNKTPRRNLIWSVVAEHIGFSVWSIWSVMV